MVTKSLLTVPFRFVIRCLAILSWLISALHFISPASADTVRLIEGDREALAFRLDLIAQAEREVFVASYMVGDDPVSLKILAAMRDAARRGVDVRLIVDGHRGDNLLPKAMMQVLISEGVDIREHMPDVRYKLELGRQRMHDKLFMVDSYQVIIGGRNQRSDFYGLAERNYLDREVYLSGEAALHVRSYFLDRWQACTSGRPDLQRKEHNDVAEQQNWKCLNDMERCCALAQVGASLDSAQAAPIPIAACDPCPMPQEITIDTGCIRFHHDIPCGEKDDPSAIAAQLTAAIRCAQRCVLMETPYLVLTRDFMNVLEELRARGVEICIVTNSLETNDHTVVHAQYANERKHMRDLGIHLYEYHGDRVLHAKALVIDEHLVMAGSYNFDVLSETRNSETALLIECPTLAEQVSRAVAKQIMESIPVPSDGLLLHFDAETNHIDSKVIRESNLKRLIAPWIKRYL